jgi:SAM-dependent methyltransferase
MKEEPELKAEIRNWWDAHSMDYIDSQRAGYRGVESSLDDGALKELLINNDRNFHDQAWFAHGSDSRFFSKLIDYSSLKGKRALEIGCGLGSHAQELTKAGAEFFAIDLAPKSVIITKRRFKIFGLNGDVIQADAENIPFPDQSFDYIWSWGVIHHSPDTPKIIQEINRLLRPGGKFGVMIYCLYSSEVVINILLRYGILRAGLLKYRFRELLERYDDGKNVGGCPHIKYYSTTEAIKLFKDFTDIKIKKFGGKGGLTKLIAPLPYVHKWLEDRIPEPVYLGFFNRFGKLMLIQGEKP